MRRGDTKKRIEEIALELFSVHGYQAVSIRDICKRLGFTESSIYYHFTNKQAIMDSLLDQVVQLVESMKDRFDIRFEKVMDVTAEQISQVAVDELVHYLLNPHVYKVISMLSIDRMSDGKANEIYQKIVFELPLKQHEKVFTEMMNRNIIKRYDPAWLSRQYYSIIYLSFQNNCVVTNLQLTDEIVKKASNEIYQGVFTLFEMIKRNEY